MLLHLLVLAPFAAAILMVVNSKEDYKSSARMAILMAVAFLAMSIALIAGGNQVTASMEWFRIPGCNIPVQYMLRAEGLGAWLVFLSCGLSLVALISAKNMEKNYRNFAIGTFALMSAMNGTFLAADAVLFFFFFEAMVIPAAIMIAAYGGNKRKEAAMTFAIYTLVGSAPMMVALWYVLTKSESSLLTALPAAFASLAPSAQVAVLLSFMLAFLVKTPIFPFHGWQAITYSEAPAPLSAILTGAMSKAGVYGFMALVLPIVYPMISVNESIASISLAMVSLGLLTAVYGALMALRATDGKKLLAFSSMSHLGVAVAGVFSLSDAMLPVVLVLLVAHGISAGVQYFLMGVAERMTGTRNINEMGGLAGKNPVFSFLFGAAGVMALAVPGTAGFVGEFGVLLSLWNIGQFFALIMGFCMILSAAYVLRFIQKVIFGTQAREYTEGAKTSAMEGAAFGVMLALLLVFGIHPGFITDALRTSSDVPTAEAAGGAAGEEAPLTEEDLKQLDAELAQMGYSEEERKNMIAQLIESGAITVAGADSTAAVASDSIPAVADSAAVADTAKAIVDSAAVQSADTANVNAEGSKND